MAAIESSLASDIKTRSHALTLNVLKPFSGRFFHSIADTRNVSQERIRVGSDTLDFQEHHPIVLLFGRINL